MSPVSSEIALFTTAALVAGGAIGWLICNLFSSRRIERLADDWQTKLDDTIRQRDRLTAEIAALRTTIGNHQAVLHQHEMTVARTQTELQSAHEKEKLLTKSIFTLRSEREDFKNKVLTFQNALASLKRQSAQLQAEFVKSGDVYKAELAKAFAKRKALEDKLENSRMEYQSFNNLLQASRSEHESVNRMLEAARTRLRNLDSMEQNVIALEAENAELKHDLSRLRQENDVLQRDVAEQEELKVQNRELAQVLKSMENSRKQYEADAKRYREHAGKSEQQSGTLQLRLDEVEKNFLEMEKQQNEALRAARDAAEVPAENGRRPKPKEADDLKEIIGIGKVFEHTLHGLGVFSFRQIANFGVADIARVNAELREFKGRMEQDDWIGQAKELYYKKYGATN